MLPAAQVTRTKQDEQRDEKFRALEAQNSALIARVEALEAKAKEPPLPNDEPVDDHSAVAALLNQIGEAIH